MPTATPSWGSCHVYGTWRGQNGAMLPGTYRVTIPERLTNATDDVIIPAGTFASGSLSTTEGTPSLALDVPATDDPDNSPSGWKLKIEVTLTGAGVEPYVIDAPVGGEVNLRTVILSAVLPPVTAAALRGVPGGLAELDEDGTLVADQLPEDIGGGVTSWEEIAALPDAPELLTEDGALEAALASKLTNPGAGTTNRVVAVTAAGDPVTVPHRSSVAGNVIVQRDSNGQVWLPAAPTDPVHATPKGYVDGAVASSAATRLPLAVSLPRMAALSSTEWPGRAAWIAANVPGYTGPIERDGAAFPTVVEPTDNVIGDRLLDRA